MEDCIWKVAGICHKHCCECEEYIAMRYNEDVLLTGKRKSFIDLLSKDKYEEALWYLNRSE